MHERFIARQPIFDRRMRVYEARALGYQLFQGYFFCKPLMHSSREIPGNKLIYLRLLQAVAAPELSYDAVEKILKHDPSLTYKLLRYLNSPLLGLRREIHSVRQAMALIGEIDFRRWVSVVAVVSLAEDKPSELVRTALLRAYFCEEIARPLGMVALQPDLFFMGLLSVADALLDRPMDEVLANLPVDAEVRTALCGGSNRFRDVYETLLAYERGDWAALASYASRFNSIEASIPDCYLTAAHRAATLAL